ncbi:SRPBCC family protein [Cellulomonas carbonis]|uniref:Polyketide cyclase n=1 Tax=Cellulomonas carbonis T26 TaxID=947969 RepID=A0A0A0BR92_9CELL|nr:SRPBCC family protein [Cellulomonas carbonis]KGM09619.1 hypothetical protein N868_01280 [Cellulomonas carbonis T26]GGB94872.1 hypothetical protein GCM10010972_04480 [Cellulomonas carbonis]
MRITRTRQIDAPADAVWRVVGPGFADVGAWASEVVRSAAVQSVGRPDAVPRGAPCAGRACSVTTPGFDGVREELLDYDDERMSLTYRAGGGTPGVVREARSTWSVTRLGPDRCLASMTTQVELAGAGRLAGPVLAYLTHRLGRRTLADLDHHVTTGRPSPRKRRAGRRRGTGPLGRVVRANAALLVLLGRSPITARTARALAALDTGWVVASGALLAAAGRRFSTGGWAAVVVTSSVVATFGALQWWHSRAGGVVTDRSATPN